MRELYYVCMYLALHRRTQAHLADALILFQTTGRLVNLYAVHGGVRRGRLDKVRGTFSGSDKNRVDTWTGKKKSAYDYE